MPKLPHYFLITRRLPIIRLDLVPVSSQHRGRSEITFQNVPTQCGVFYWQDNQAEQPVIFSSLHGFASRLPIRPLLICWYLKKGTRKSRFLFPRRYRNQPLGADGSAPERRGPHGCRGSSAVLRQIVSPASDPPCTPPAPCRRGCSRASQKPSWNPRWPLIP